MTQAQVDAEQQRLDAWLEDGTLSETEPYVVSYYKCESHETRHENRLATLNKDTNYAILNELRSCRLRLIEAHKKVDDDEDRLMTNLSGDFDHVIGSLEEMAEVLEAYLAYEHGDRNKARDPHAMFFEKGDA